MQFCEKAGCHVVIDDHLHSDVLPICGSARAMLKIDCSLTVAALKDKVAQATGGSDLARLTRAGHALCRQAH